MKYLTMSNIAHELEKSIVLTNDQEVNALIYKLHEWATENNILPISDSMSEFYNINYQNKLYSFGFTYEDNSTWICQTEDDFSLSNNIDYEKISNSLKADFFTYLKQDKLTKSK